MIVTGERPFMLGNYLPGFVQPDRDRYLDDRKELAPDDTCRQSEEEGTG